MFLSVARPTTPQNTPRTTRFRYFAHRKLPAITAPRDAFPVLPEEEPCRSDRESSVLVAGLPLAPSACPTHLTPRVAREYLCLWHHRPGGLSFFRRCRRVVLRALRLQIGRASCRERVEIS